MIRQVGDRLCVGENIAQAPTCQLHRHRHNEGRHRSVRHKKAVDKAAGYAVSGVVAEVIMVAGYFGYAALLLGKGIGAAASIPGNLVQAAMGLVIGLVLFFLLKRSKVLDKLALQ